MNTMSSSPALLLLALLLAAHDIASAQYVCPTLAPTNITCFSGATLSSWPSGGSCTCLCGTSASNADNDYAVPTPPKKTIFVVSTGSACSNATCASKFPGACTPPGRYVNATYAAYSAVQAANAPKQGAATTQMCISFSYTCPANYPASMGSGIISCPFGVPGPATVTSFSFLDVDTQASCNSAGQTYASLATNLKICNTSNCNAPASSAAAVKAGSVYVAVLAAVAVAAHFL
jgi:hypothetical protein